MKKIRIFSLVLALITLLGVFSACAPKPIEPEESSTEPAETEPPVVDKNDCHILYGLYVPLKSP